MTTLTWRVAGAAVLDRRIYEEVEADSRANGQAAAVVLLASIAGGIGLIGLGGPSVRALMAGIIGSVLCLCSRPGACLA